MPIEKDYIGQPQTPYGQAQTASGALAGNSANLRCARPSLRV